MKIAIKEFVANVVLLIGLQTFLVFPADLDQPWRWWLSVLGAVLVLFGVEWKARIVADKRKASS